MITPVTEARYQQYIREMITFHKEELFKLNADFDAYFRMKNANYPVRFYEDELGQIQFEVIPVKENR